MLYTCKGCGVTRWRWRFARFRLPYSQDHFFFPLPVYVWFSSVFMIRTCRLQRIRTVNHNLRLNLIDVIRLFLLFCWDFQFKKTPMFDIIKSVQVIPSRAVAGFWVLDFSSLCPMISTSRFCPVSYSLTTKLQRLPICGACVFFFYRFVVIHVFNY